MIVNRRTFTGMMPALFAVGMAGDAVAQSAAAPAKPTELYVLQSGTFKPGPGKAPQAQRVSHAYTMGLLKAGNIRVEMHETIQQKGAEHEAIGAHKHNEVWFVQRGVASLMIEGVEHRLEAGDMGLVCAGDTHWIKNIGEDELAYFVMALGSPE